MERESLKTTNNNQQQLTILLFLLHDLVTAVIIYQVNKYLDEADYEAGIVSIENIMCK